MKILKYQSFLETMQFAALTNAQRLAKQEEERRKSKREEEDSKKNIPTETKDDIKHDVYQLHGGEGQEEMEIEGEETEMEIEGEGQEIEMEGEEPEM